MGHYAFYGIKVNNTVIPASDCSIDPAIQPIIEGAYNGIDPSFVTIGQTKPVAQITVPSVSLIGTFGLGGVATSSNTVIYFGQKDDGAIWKAGSTHAGFTLNEGMIVLTGIECGGDGTPVKATYSIYGCHDGTNYPYTVSLATALPTLTTLTGVQTLYSVKWGATSIPCSSVSIDTGVAVYQAGDGSRIDPTFLAIQEIKPTVKMATPALATAYGVCGEDGLDIGATNVVILLGSRDSGGVYSDNDASHCSITLDGGVLAMDGFSTDHNGEASATYTAYPVSADGSTLPLLFVYTTDVNLAIPDELAELWTLGPCTLDVLDTARPTAIGGDAATPGTHSFSIQSLNFETGTVVEQLGHSGNHLPTTAAIMSRAPKASMQVAEVGKLDFELLGAAQSAITFGFRKIAEGSTRVALSSEVHIGITMVVGYAQPGTIQGTMGQVASQEITVIPAQSGENAIFTIATDWDPTPA